MTVGPHLARRSARGIFSGQGESLANLGYDSGVSEHVSGGQSTPNFVQLKCHHMGLGMLPYQDHSSHRAIISGGVWRDHSKKRKHGCSHSKLSQDEAMRAMRADSVKQLSHSLGIIKEGPLPSGVSR